MPKSLSQREFEQLLGRIQTRIVGLKHYEATWESDAHVRLEKVPENPHDTAAIPIENGFSKKVGRLSLQIAITEWMALMPKAGRIRIDGCLPANQPTRFGDRPGSIPIRVMVFQTDNGSVLFEDRPVVTAAGAVHRFVCTVYSEVQQYRDPDPILKVREMLRPLAQRALLPEKHRLLALIPGTARQPRNMRAFHAVIKLRQLPGGLMIGDRAAARAASTVGKLRRSGTLRQITCSAHSQPLWRGRRSSMTVGDCILCQVDYPQSIYLTN